MKASLPLIIDELESSRKTIEQMKSESKQLQDEIKTLKERRPESYSSAVAKPPAIVPQSPPAPTPSVITSIPLRIIPMKEDATKYYLDFIFNRIGFIASSPQWIMLRGLFNDCPEQFYMAESHRSNGEEIPHYTITITRFSLPISVHLYHHPNEAGGRPTLLYASIQSISAQTHSTSRHDYGRDLTVIAIFKRKSELQSIMTTHYQSLMPKCISDILFPTVDSWDSGSTSTD